MSSTPRNLHHHIGVAVIAFATLVQELLLVRLVSARLLNNYAFLIVSLTMTGFAVGAIVLSLEQERILRRLGESQRLLFCLYTLFTLAAWIVFCHAGDPSGARTDNVAVVLASLSFSSVLALPFVFSGLSIGAFLSAPGLAPSRVYFSDLLGSAVGCAAAIGGLSWLGLEHTILASLALVVVVGAALYPPRRLAPGLLLCATALAVLLTWVWRDAALRISFPRHSMLSMVTDEFGGEVEYVQWDPIARIEVAHLPGGLPPSPSYPVLVGDDLGQRQRITRFLTQNNYAFTYIVNYHGDPAELEGLKRTIYASSYVATRQRHSNPSVLNIGVGGGIDLLTALAYDARSVTGVEINSATVEILTERYADLFKPLLSDPRVHLVNADGRHYLTREDETYDIIQLSGVDSYSGVQKSAHVFSETYLYTQEAVGLYLRRLSPDGVLNLMRLEHDTPCEVVRLVTTAVAALRDQGVRDPAAHVVVIGQHDERFLAVLVSRSPWSAAEVSAIEAWLSDKPYFSPAPLADPFYRGSPRSVHEAYLLAERKGLGQAFIDNYIRVIRPATDDWPFFFQFSNWTHMWMALTGSEPLPVFQGSILFLLLLLGALMLVTVVLPLALFRRRGLSISRPGWHVLYFALIGLAFLMIEIYLMQRLTLILGSPIYAITVVLMTLLAATAVGSFLLPWLRRALPSAMSAALILGGLGTLLVLLSGQLNALVALPLPARVLAAVVLVTPLGVIMGVFFPLGLEEVKRSAPSFTPWAWGINGVFSVISPIAAVALSATYGQMMTFIVAIPMYLMAGGIASRLGFWRRDRPG